MRTALIGTLITLFSLPLILAGCGTQQQEQQEEQRSPEQEFEEQRRQTEDELENGSQSPTQQQSVTRRQRTLRQQQNQPRTGTGTSTGTNTGMSPEVMVSQEDQQNLSQLLTQASEQPVEQGAFGDSYAVQRTGQDEFTVYMLREDSSDQSIQEKVRTMLQTQPQLAEVTVQSQNGEVTLSGSVENMETLAKAVGIALNTQGVEAVRSKVQVSNEGQQQPVNQDQ